MDTTKILDIKQQLVNTSLFVIVVSSFIIRCETDICSKIFPGISNIKDCCF